VGKKAKEEQKIRGKNGFNKSGSSFQSTTKDWFYLFLFLFLLYQKSPRIKQKKECSGT
jgi:hypothetical protein